DRHLQPWFGAQPRLDAGRLLAADRIGVDAPDLPILVFLEDRIGRALQLRIGVDRGGGGLGGEARAPCNYLKCGLGHFSKAVMLTNRYRNERAFARSNQPEGSGRTWPKVPRRSPLLRPSLKRLRSRARRPPPSRKLLRPSRPRRRSRR